MGWTSGFNKQEAQDYIRRNFTSNGYQLIKQARVGGTVYAAVKHPSGDEFLAVVLLKAHKGDYGVKFMEESMGPCEVTCPLDLLEMVPPSTSEYGMKWRAEVQAYHARRAQKFAIGDTVRVYGKEYVITGGIKRSWYIKSKETGTVYKCGASKMRKES